MKALVVGWFSFEQGHATAGDLLSRDLACEWLEKSGCIYDVALAPPFEGGVNWRTTNSKDYSYVVFVCGPFQQSELESEFFVRFANCRLIGLNLTMLVPLEQWNPFDFLIERDSSRKVNADMVFLSRQQQVPVVGVCLVESYPGAVDYLANAAIHRLLGSREVAIVNIDTRLDCNSTGLRSAAEIESLIARVDVLITTRLHGTVLALKNGVPVIAIDPEAGGAKIKRQAERIGWSIMFNADALTDQILQSAFDYCLTEDARDKAKACSARAVQMVEHKREEFIAALMNPKALEECYQSRAEAIVSIIIPCYNQAHYLGEAIESVLAQSYPNFEIIVVNDGSPDNTAEVAARYPEVCCIWQENQGLSGARNTGIRESKGEFLVFLDADDRLTPNALQAGLNCFHAHPECAFVSGHHRYIRGDGSLLSENPPQPIDSDYYLALLQRNYIGMHATVMYQRHVFDAIGLFDTSLKSCEDYDLYLRITKSLPVYRHNELAAEYRRHDSNMTYCTERMLKTALTALGSQWAYVKDKPEYVKAYRTGIRFWRNHFGKLLIKQIVKNLLAGRWQRGMKEISMLLRYCLLWLSALLLEFRSRPEPNC